MTRPFAVLVFAAAAAVAPLGAQASRGDDVPTGYMPPPGMCRVWVDGVPAGQQPAPTDCTTAQRSRSSKSRVLFGEHLPVSSLPSSVLGNANGMFGAGSVAGTSGRRGGYADVDENRNPRGELCLDAGHRGLCDDSAPGVAGCIDANRDGKCDDARREIPAMIDAGAFRAGSAIGAICIDRNRDGKCDETWQAGDVCLDRDGDGKCDTPLATMIKPPEPTPVKSEPAPTPDKSRARAKRPE